MCYDIFMGCLLCQEVETQNFAEFSIDCARCGSTAELRQVAKFFLDHMPLKEGAKVLSVAPSEAELKYFVQPRFLGKAKYTAIQPELSFEPAQIPSPHRLMRMDLTRMIFSDHSFDVILCNQVLPHVKSDYVAISELHRCLKSEGVALLNVNLVLPKTKRAPEMRGEDPKKFTQEFLAANGTEWLYGEDYFERIEAAGFFVHRLRDWPKGGRELFLCFKFKEAGKLFLKGIHVNAV